MQRSLRHKTIIGAVSTGATIDVSALATLTGASAITIRRDLADLAEQGMVRRVRGGVTRADVRGTLMPFSVRFETDRNRKDALGDIAATLIEDDQSLILDNGTTCYAVARHLVGRRLTTLALSLHAAAALATRPEGAVIVPGGPIETDTLAFTSHEAIRAIENTNPDVVVIGTCSAKPGFGLTSTSYADAQVKRACLAAAPRRILVTTADKLDRTSTFRFAGIAEITDLVTTSDAAPDVIDEFRAEGVAIHLAHTEPDVSEK